MSLAHPLDSIPTGSSHGKPLVKWANALGHMSGSRMRINSRQVEVLNVPFPAKVDSCP